MCVCTCEIVLHLILFVAYLRNCSMFDALCSIYSMLLYVLMRVLLCQIRQLATSWSVGYSVLQVVWECCQVSRL